MNCLRFNNIHRFVAITLIMVMVASCSTTSSLEDEEKLYTGLKPIKYNNHDSGDHYDQTKAEVEAALATAPNGAFFGSSYYRTPFPYGLWIWNAMSQKKGGVSKWIVNTFGKGPVLMSNVNPALRSSVARTVLQNNGYFHGDVNYNIIDGKPKTTRSDKNLRPRTSKIQYDVNFGHLFTLDSISYSNFPAEVSELIDNDNTLLAKGNPFDISTLDAERNRLYKLFRNHGYYFYKPSYVSYLADTLQVPGKVQLQLHFADSLPVEAMHKWIIGKTSVRLRRHFMEQTEHDVVRRFLNISFGGSKPPIRPRIILGDTKLRPGMLFSQDLYQESMTNIQAKGVYSSVDITFEPRYNADGTIMEIPDTISQVTRDGESRKGAGIMDMTINCVLDKPYDFTMNANYISKTSGRMGPGVGIGFTKRNAFRGAELLSFNLGINYEFQLGGHRTSLSDSYEFTGDVSLELPRLLLPGFLRKRRFWEIAPSTNIRLAGEIVSRSGFYRRNIMTGELSYTFQPTPQSRHQFSPVIISYDKLAETTDEYVEKLQQSPVLLASSQNYVMTKMRYSYIYTSPRSYRNPVYFAMTLTESSNLLALGYLASGYSWSEKNKKLFAAPFAQFFKVEAEWTKNWRFSENSSLVAHAVGAVMASYGNSHSAPYSEYFYIGGANSVRAFSARSIGPGSMYNDDSKMSAITHIGDMKLQFNLEYRPRIFGSLYGAVFLDAGNVWNLKTLDFDTIETNEPYNGNIPQLFANNEGNFKLKNFISDLAVGVGVGLRYDLDFFVVRIDWGFAVHTPYATSRRGYFNTPDFAHGQCINFAVGYPF